MSMLSVWMVMFVAFSCDKEYKSVIAAIVLHVIEYGVHFFTGFFKLLFQMFCGLIKRSPILKVGKEKGMIDEKFTNFSSIVRSLNHSHKFMRSKIKRGRHVDSFTKLIFPNGFEGVKIGSKESNWVLSHLQPHPYILQVIEDFINDLKAGSKFPG